jgi:hypothetical protein
VPSFTGTATAVARETVWLNTTTDALPALPASAGGPWQVIQAYVARSRPHEQTSIFVTRGEIQDERVANIRIRPAYQFMLRLHWPVRVTASLMLETEQQAFDNAVDLLLQRIRGPIGDKTHGGAFLSVGEVPRSPGVHVAFEDAAHTFPADKELRATCTYYADDFEVND